VASPELALGVASLELSLLALSSLEEPEVGFSLDVLVVLVAVVEVAVVCAAAASALVSVGGVMLGVLFGTVSETLLPPHAARPTPLSRITHVAMAAGADARGRRRGRANGKEWMLTR
jgi:hypothetical protein